MIKSIILCLVLGMFFNACRSTDKSTPPSSQATQVANASPEAAEVEFTSVRSMQPAVNVVLPGELKPWNKAYVYAKLKGFISQVNVDRGSVVKKGQVLAVLEAPEMITAMSQAKAQVASAEASLIQQQAKQQASSITYRRIKETNQTPGAVSANEIDMAYAHMMADSALCRAAQENLHASQAQVASHAQLINYLTVIAPFDGTITERNVSPGELVGSDNKPLFMLEDHSTLRLTIAIPENLANSVTEKSKVYFTVQADPLKQYEAQYSRSANSLQENNRTMIAEFDYKNTNRALKAGMYAEVKLPMTRNSPSLFVVKSALIHSTEGVFVVRDRGQTAEWVAVQKGNTLDSLIEVFGAIKEGDQIVRQAYEELRNGQAIKRKKQL